MRERFLAVLRVELQQLRTDPAVVLFAFIVPSVLIAFAAGGAKGGPTGIVSGVAVMFAFFVVIQAGFSFFREYGWGTWERLRTLPVEPWVLVIAKVLPFTLLALVQLFAIYGVALLYLDIRIANVGGFGLVATALALCVSTVAILLVNLTRTIQQFTSIANMVAVAFAGFAGALTPSSELPGWAAAIGKVVPQYWAIEALRSLGGTSVHWDHVLPNVAVLGGFSIIFGALAGMTFNPGASKTSWGTN